MFLTKFRNNQISEEFVFLRSFEKENIYFSFLGLNKIKVSKIISSILLEIFDYKQKEIAHIIFFFWSKKKELFL